MNGPARIALLVSTTLLACWGGPNLIPSATLYGETDLPGWGDNQKQVFERRNVQPGQTREMYRVPVNSHFVLTHFCSDSEEMELRVDVPEIGLILTDDRCTTFYPGIHMVESQGVLCANTDDEVRACQIAGIETW